MHSDAIAFVKNCVRCQQADKSKATGAPLQSLDICGEPNERVHIDLFGPLKTKSPSGNTMIMVITDSFTKIYGARGHSEQIRRDLCKSTL